MGGCVRHLLAGVLFLIDGRGLVVGSCIGVAVGAAALWCGSGGSVDKEATTTLASRFSPTVMGVGEAWPS